MNDDDEPITDEWWITEQYGTGKVVKEGIFLRILDSMLQMMVIDTRCNHDGTRQWILAELPAVRTRGDVRALVKLLGRE